MKGPVKGSGGRELTVRVKTARGRTASSQRWLERQLNDPYVARSKREGYRSRAAYKLIEIDDKHHILAPGKRVVDLGAAPGGWSQVAVQRVGSTDADPRVVAIDYLEMDELPGVKLFIKDFLDEDAPALLEQALGGPADVVLSDMAAPTTGHQQTDHLRTIYLAEVGADFALNVLRPGGHFLVEGVSRRRRGQPADDAEAELRDRAPHQAAGKPRRLGRAVRAGQGLQGAQGGCRRGRGAGRCG